MSFPSYKITFCGFITFLHDFIFSKPGVLRDFVAGDGFSKPVLAEASSCSMLSVIFTLRISWTAGYMVCYLQTPSFHVQRIVAYFQ